MLRRVRAAMRDKLVSAAAEGTERGTAPLRQQLAEMEATLDHLRRRMQHAERRNLKLAADRLAVESSAAWILENLPQAPSFPDKLATLRHAVGQAPHDGMALEFGVFTGGTLRAIVEEFKGTDVFGFDSFEGLPEHWRTGFPAGTFDVDRVPTVEGAQMVVGWFEDTLPSFLAEHPGPIAFLHVDCDLYSSTVTVLEQVGSRLVPGSVILFDEYLNYPGWQHGEHQAWQEYVVRTGTTFDYLGYSRDDEQVAIRVTA
jgi:hypothetical protein